MSSALIDGFQELILAMGEKHKLMRIQTQFEPPCLKPFAHFRPSFALTNPNPHAAFRLIRPFRLRFSWALFGRSYRHPPHAEFRNVALANGIDSNPNK